ncbi:MAG: IS21-like element IS100 family transposase [Chloroflexota bacterium]
MQSEGIQMEMKVLHDHGWSISRLAREYGLSWNTVKREIASSSPRRYPQRTKPTALTAAQEAHVQRRLAMCPTIRGTILHHELCRDYGYTGSYPAFVRHLHLLRPGAVVEPLIRFETNPGLQLQTDWAQLGIWPLADGEAALFGLVNILGYSRTPALRFATDHTRQTTLVHLVSCLDDLGGIPREILTDRDSVFCIGQTSDGRAIFAPEWIDLCAVLGTIPRACRPYRAQTKGKVERMVREVKESFLAWLTGQILPSAPTLGDYDRLARQWRQEIILPRRHRTTGRIIGEAWAEERALLRPVPARLLHMPSEPALPSSVIDLTAHRLGEYVQVRELAEYEVAL